MRHLGWAALIVLAAVAAGVLLAGLIDPASGTGRWFGILLPPVAGALIWRASGADWWAALSWTVPVIGLGVMAWWLAPDPLAPALQVLTLLIAAAMVFVPPLGAWWYRHVLRRDAHDRSPWS